MTKVYKNRSSANRAAKKTFAGQDFTVEKVSGGYRAVAVFPAKKLASYFPPHFVSEVFETYEAATNDALQKYPDYEWEIIAAKDGFYYEVSAPVTERHHTPETLAALGLYGDGTEEQPICPFCCRDHIDNGYSIHCEETPHEKYEYACLGCGNEWGPEIATDFSRAFDAAGGNNKGGICRALRTIAADWTDGRKAFIAAAVEMGLNRNNAAQEYFVAHKK